MLITHKQLLDEIDRLRKRNDWLRGELDAHSKLVREMRAEMERLRTLLLKHYLDPDEQVEPEPEWVDLNKLTLEEENEMVC